MISRPVFINIPSKIYELILLSMVVIIYTCVCAEADMYVPAFPQMIKYFNIAENEIQLVLSINFLGLCLASIFSGPLSDSFGRRKVILGGLFLLMISSIILVGLDDFKVLLFWRFIQGIAAAVPMVCAGAMFMDQYSGEKASKLIGFINAVITAAMAAAPVIGAYISEEFGWRANFIVVMLLSIISFFGFLLLIEESLKLNLKRKLNLISITKDYAKVLSSLTFICYMMLACLPFIVIIVYITNLSVIFVNHLGINLVDYSYYQASTMGTFVIFSLLSVKIINTKGVNFTKNFGVILSVIGSCALLIVSLVDHTSVILICISMAVVAAGGSMMSGTFGVKALSLFPEINGTAMAACTALRLLLIAVFVLISEFYFDGTIIPIAFIIAGYTLFTAGFYILLSLKEK